jgi:hypothetical protein
MWGGWVYKSIETIVISEKSTEYNLTLDENFGLIQDFNLIS